MNLDVILFRFINNLASRWGALDAIGIFFSEHLIFIMVVVAVIFCWQERARLKMFVFVFGATLSAYVVNKIIGLIYFRPRPFVALAGVHQLIEKSGLDKSFPSGHATAAFAMAFAVFLYNKRWGWPLLIAAALVGLGRVYVGVHYPLDILGGLTLGALSAFIGSKVVARLKLW